MKVESHYTSLFNHRCKHRIKCIRIGPVGLLCAYPLNGLPHSMCWGPAPLQHLGTAVSMGTRVKVGCWPWKWLKQPVQEGKTFPPTAGYPMCSSCREAMFTLYFWGDPSRAVDVLWLVDCRDALHSRCNVTLGTPPATPWHLLHLIASCLDIHWVMKDLF